MRPQAAPAPKSSRPPSSRVAQPPVSTATPKRRTLFQRIQRVWLVLFVFGVALVGGLRLTTGRTLPDGCPPACGGLTLSQKNLAGMDLSSANLNATDLSGSNLTGANLSNSTLVGANLNEAILIGASLAGASLRAADLTRANMIGIQLATPPLPTLSVIQRIEIAMGRLTITPTQLAASGPVDFTGATLDGAMLDRVDLTGAILAAVSLQGTQLVGANLSRANLQGANLTGARLTGANLSDVNLNAANLTNANFIGVAGRHISLVGAVLVDSDGTGSDLRQADLRGADMRGAFLGASNLWSADLKGANLEDAWIGAADLSLANLNETSFLNVDMTGSNLQGATLVRSDLRGANLRGVNLNGADLRWAYLIEIQLKDGSTLNEEQLLNQSLEDEILLSNRDTSLTQLLGNLNTLERTIAEVSALEARQDIDFRFTTLSDLLTALDLTYAQFRATKLLELLGMSPEIGNQPEDKLSGRTVVELLSPQKNEEIEATLAELESLHDILTQIRVLKAGGTDVLGLTFEQLLAELDLSLQDLLDSRLLEAFDLVPQLLDFNGAKTGEFTLWPEWYSPPSKATTQLSTVIEGAQP